ncbi:MAG: Flp family type IVb pilin [Rhodoferax sp.]|uniref:Flp family type IVb pilin n=1 Tax=Rhodoferax sp. TaxID=50421 RepID=UPI00184F8DA8|nr:Flp family type IVb pilin [Rhodoferax sp.]NMM20022.1 Flp family type IVb pilin [Rhodoferax sp.]
MNKVFLATRNFLSDEEGVTAIEYGLIAALIAVAVIATVYLVGQELDKVFIKIKNCLATPAACVTTP